VTRRLTPIFTEASVSGSTFTIRFTHRRQRRAVIANSTGPNNR